MSIEIKVVNPEVDKRWDEFVLQHPLGSIYHHSAWVKVHVLTYGYSPFYIALEETETGRLEGILPMVVIKGRLTGRRIVSLPFTQYCDPLVRDSELTKIIGFAKEHNPNTDFLELRYLKNTEHIPGVFERQSSYVTHILDLSIGLEKVFRSFHDTSIRQRIRRAEKNNLTLRMADQEEDLKKFYKLHTIVRKKHGLPPHPYSFFLNMWRSLRPHNFMFLPLIEYQGGVIAAAVVLKFKETFYLEYSDSDHTFLKLCPNQKLIWEVIKRAYEGGGKFFDFGRSSLTNQPLIDFKERWGGKRHSLSYIYFPKQKRIRTEDGFVRKVVNFVNHFLPDRLLELEGKLLYPHLG